MKTNKRNLFLLCILTIFFIGIFFPFQLKFTYAASLTDEACEKADNNSLSPIFYIQAGELLESQGKKEEALKLYQIVKSKYALSAEAATIDKYIERASAH